MYRERIENETIGVFVKILQTPLETHLNGGWMVRARVSNARLPKRVSLWVRGGGCARAE